MVYGPLQISSASGSKADDENVAANAIDNKSSTRFSSEGKGAYLLLTLAKPSNVKDIEISWHNGDKRRTTFKVTTSVDGAKFLNAHAGYLKSSGKTTGFEKYNVYDKTVKAVKITFDSNTENKWLSITGVRINGDEPLE